MDAIGNGISNVAVDLAVEQSRLGHAVSLASRRGDYWTLLRRAGVAVAEVDYSISSPLGLIRALMRTRRAIKQSGAEIVHSHTIAAAVISRFAAWRLDCVTVATVHNEYQRGVLLMALAHHVVGVSDAVTASLVRRGVPAGSISTVVNGPVGSSRLGPDFTRAPSHGPSIVHVGGLTRRKGVDTLLLAFEIVADQRADVRLTLVGAPDWQDFIDQVERSPHRDRIDLVGFQADPRPYVSGAAVFALASRRDPMPLVVGEAMALDVPVVASEVDGIPQAVAFGEAGLLVDPESPDQLAAAIRRVLEDDELSARLVAAGRRQAAAFSVGRVTQDYVDLYRRVGRSTT